MICLLLSAVLSSFSIGPAIGVFIPIQEEDDPWGSSFLLGISARYQLAFADLEAELQFTELNIDPDSSRGFEYSMVPLSLGLNRNLAGIRTGIGLAVYTIEARQEIDDGLSAVWKGTYPGMYLSLGKDLEFIPGTACITAKFNMIDFDGLWIGLTGSYLF